MAEQKPKIILVWGVHHDENEVTEYLANALKPELEKRGFDVKIIKAIPSKAINSDQVDSFNKEAKDAVLLIDLHTTPSEKYQRYSNKLRKSKFWSGRQINNNFFADPTKPITLFSANDFFTDYYHRPFKFFSDNVFTIEIPTEKKSLITIRKITSLIDIEAKIRLGIYHTPRKPPFKPKTDRETAIRIEQQRRLRETGRLKLLRTFRERMKPR